MTLYKVTSNPTVCNGAESNNFSLGDIAERYDSENPDADGDIRAHNLTNDPDRDDWHYIALSCLTPVDEIPVEPVAPSNDPERVATIAVAAVLLTWGHPVGEVGQILADVARVDAALLA